METSERGDASSGLYRLQRFVSAQETTYAQVREELAAGRKRTHWMWFIFPQIAGLGSSPMAQRFALSGLDEASAYLRHPVLGPRLRECTGLVLAVEALSVSDIFGYPDDLKFHSSVTLFEEASKVLGEPAEDRVFAEARLKYFDGSADAGTLKMLQAQHRGPASR